MKPNRNKHKALTYAVIMGNECANPDCEYGTDIETHHVVPLKYGGEDAFWNMVRLCRHCHRHMQLHRGKNDMELTLYTWKCYQELTLLGYTLDEAEEDFNEKRLNALRKAIISNL